mmetsp:Transcript_986/g.2118  ORF Transcript_986/g.2118 Transcript_986/m.2118 type:complete len:310 (-) Transcript_986:301-1230(-)
MTEWARLIRRSWSAARACPCGSRSASPSWRRMRPGVSDPPHGTPRLQLRILTAFRLALSAARSTTKQWTRWHPGLIRGLLSRQQHSSQLQTRDWAKPRRCPSCRWIGSNRWRVLSGHPLSGSSRFLPNRIPSMLTCQSLLLPSPRQNIHTMMATTTHHHNHYSHHDDDDDDDHHHHHAQLASTPSPDLLPSIGQPHIHAHAHTHAHAHSRVRHTRTHMCAYTCTFLQVAALFSQLDPSGSGKIGIQGLSQHSVALGPHAATPFNLIEQMDADGDGDVTREEMLTYFRYASAMLNDGEFDEIIQMCAQLG